MTFIIDFDCHWDDYYPVEHTCGTFSLHVNSELDVIFYIKKNFLDHSSLLNYCFMIDDGQNITIISKKGE
jgi:hypothetical protein